MVSSILIIVASLALFLLWFRYTCRLILETRAARDFAAEIATENRLNFPSVPEQLTECPIEALDSFASSLERDYEVMNSLVKQAVNVELGGVSLEQRILRLDFLVMRAWYALSCRFSSSSARPAVEEMRRVVARLANAYGEQVVGIRAT